LGGFDEDFFAHQEEIDLCWRMWSAGWRVMVEPRSAVYHLGAGTLPPSARKLYYNYRNNLAMLYKNLPQRRMRFIVFVRMVLDGLAAIVYLLQGRPRNFAAVVRAHRDFRRMKKGADIGIPGGGSGVGLREKRKEIQAIAEKSDLADMKSVAKTESNTAKRHANNEFAPKDGKITTENLAGVYRESIILSYLFGRRKFSQLKIK
jgi:hypothetical protein